MCSAGYGVRSAWRAARSPAGPAPTAEPDTPPDCRAQHGMPARDIRRSGDGCKGCLAGSALGRVDTALLPPGSPLPHWSFFFPDPGADAGAVPVTPATARISSAFWLVSAWTMPCSRAASSRALPASRRSWSRSASAWVILWATRRASWADCLRCSVCCWRSPAPLGSALVCDSSRPPASASSPAKLPRHLAFPRWHRRRVAAGAAGVIHRPPRRRERFQAACARALSNSAGTWSDRNRRDSR